MVGRKDFGCQYYCKMDNVLPVDISDLMCRNELSQAGFGRNGDIDDDVCWILSNLLNITF